MKGKKTDFFDHPRYNINKFLLCCNGQWPYQKKSHKTVLLTITLIYSVAALPAQFAEVYIHRDNWSTMIPALGPIFVHFGCIVKVVNSVAGRERMHNLLSRMRTDWETPMGDEEKILAQFADDGRRFTILYTVWLYSSMIVFLALPIVPRILMVTGVANFSSTYLFPIPVHFTPHDEDYYVILQTYLCSGIFLIISITIAVDGMYVVFVQHACGIFSIIGYRLEHMVEGDDLDIDLRPGLVADKTFWIVADCVKKHKKAIEFVVLLDSAYSWSFLFLLGLNMLSISVTGLQVIWGANPDRADEAVRQVLFVGAEVLHLFFENVFSQKLTDHSLLVYESLTKSKWYQTSFRTRKLINFMLMKSAIPWELKAGKIFAMSMENFSAILRTSMSYLTILGSMD